MSVDTTGQLMVLKNYCQFFFSGGIIALWFGLKKKSLSLLQIHSELFMGERPWSLGFAAEWMGGEESWLWDQEDVST